MLVKSAIPMNIEWNAKLVVIDSPTGPYRTPVHMRPRLDGDPLRNQSIRDLWPRSWKNALHYVALP
jgi:hypothetical protein